MIYEQDGVNFETEITDVNTKREKQPLCEILLALFRYFKGKAEERIRKRFSDISESNIFWVLSVPSAWKQETCLLYRDLAIEVIL